MKERPTSEADAAPLRGGGSAETADFSVFARIFADEENRMKSVAWNLLRNEADCEDAIQDAFLKVYRSSSGFAGRSSPSTWIYRILVNACLDLRRRRVRRPESPLPDAGMPGEAARPAAQSLRVGLEQALEGLGPVERSVFVLYEVEGFKHREIAGILGIPEGTSKNTLFRAKRELRERLLEREREMTP